MTVHDSYCDVAIYRPPWAVPTAVLFGFLGIVALIVAAIASSVAFVALIIAATMCLGDGFHVAAMIVGLMAIVHLAGFYLYLPGPHRPMLGLVLGVITFASIGAGLAAGLAGAVTWIVVAVMLTHGAAAGGLRLTYRSEHLTSHEQWRAKHLRNKHCPHCLYDIRNLPAARCPECGGPL